MADIDVTQKVGPLPLWAYGVVLTGGAWIIYLVRNRQKTTPLSELGVGASPGHLDGIEDPDTIYVPVTPGDNNDDDDNDEPETPATPAPPAPAPPASKASHHGNSLAITAINAVGNRELCMG